MRSILGAFASLAISALTATSCLAQANGDPTGAILGTSRAQEHAQERAEGKKVPTDPPKKDVTPDKDAAQKDASKKDAPAKDATAKDAAPKDAAPKSNSQQASKQTKDAPH